MHQFHLQQSLPGWGTKTYVNWSTSQANKAIVFIHGFSGSSMETFGDFNLEFRHREEYANSDVFFYGYDSLRIQTMVSSDSFFEFLQTLNNNAEKLAIDSGAQIKRNQKYREIIIVAHSLGAVVARYSLLTGHAEKCTWLNKCKLVLFAPAHKGAKKAIKLYSQLPGFMKYLGPLAEFFIVTINEIMEGSDLIKELEEKHNILLKDQKPPFAIAREVVWAENDRIVNCRNFGEDPKPQVIKKKTHVQVCKPNARYTRPFEILKSVLT